MAEPDRTFQCPHAEKGQSRCPEWRCDCFVDQRPDDPHGVHPEVFIIGVPQGDTSLTKATALNAERLKRAADALDSRADLCVGWAGDLAKEWRAVAAWLRLEADVIAARGDKYAVDISGDHALGVADAILGGAAS